MYIKGMRKLALTLILGLLLAPLAAAQSEPSHGGTLRVAINSDPTNLDPHLSTAFITRVVLASVVEGLFALDSEYQPIPDLATGFDASDDQLTYTIHLRDDAVFHDGSDMTSADVVASLGRWLEVSTPGRNLSPDIVSFGALDDYTVQFEFSRPIGALLISALAFSYQLPAILPASQIEGLAEEAVLQQPIGTGPFRIANVAAGNQIRLERHEEFSSRAEPTDGMGGEKIAWLDAVVLHVAPESAVRAAGLEAGDFDFVLNLPTDGLPRFAANSNLKLYRPYNGSLDIVLNSKTGPLSDQLLRDAFVAALDMDSMMMAAFGDPSLYRIDGGIWPQETAWWTSAGTEDYNQADNSRASELLAEAGYDGTPIRWMTTRDNAGYYEHAVVATELLSQAGFVVDLEVVDFATILSRRFDDTAWEVFQTGFSIQPDPTQYLVLDCEWPAFWCDPEKDRLLEELSLDAQFEDRFAIWEELQAYYWEFKPAVKVGDYFNLHGSTNNVHGYASFNQVLWHNVWMD